MLRTHLLWTFILSVLFVCDRQARDARWQLSRQNRITQALKEKVRTNMLVYHFPEAQDAHTLSW